MYRAHRRAGSLQLSQLAGDALQSIAAHSGRRASLRLLDRATRASIPIAPCAAGLGAADTTCPPVEEAPRKLYRYRSNHAIAHIERMLLCSIRLKNREVNLKVHAQDVDSFVESVVPILGACLTTHYTVVVYVFANDEAGLVGALTRLNAAQPPKFQLAIGGRKMSFMPNFDAPIYKEVTHIGDVAFFNSIAPPTLKDLPKLQSIGRLSFGNARGAATLQRLKNLKHIGAAAFLNTQGTPILEELPSLETIERHAFADTPRPANLEVVAPKADVHSLAFQTPPR